MLCVCIAISLRIFGRTLFLRVESYLGSLIAFPSFKLMLEWSRQAISTSSQRALLSVQHQGSQSSIVPSSSHPTFANIPRTECRLSASGRLSGQMHCTICAQIAPLCQIRTMIRETPRATEGFNDTVHCIN